MIRPDYVGEYVTDAVADFFWIEIRNERQGGVTPSTLTSAIDSLSQQPDPAFWGLGPEDVVSLLVIRDAVPGDTELRDLLR